ncbi:MAG: hypothetical protein U0790_07650 [Isosphaeraceae bacterium]
MMLRCLTPVATLGVLLTLGAGIPSSAARAASMNPNASTTTANYRLISSVDLPVPDASIQAPQVVASIAPPGGVVPPKQSDGTEGSPLTVLPDSHGFDPNHLVVLLLDSKNDAGQPEQKFGLLFDGQGMKAGGVLHFALSIDSALASNPPVLKAQTPGFEIIPDTPDPVPPTTVDGGGNGTPVQGNQIPEPLSLVLWSAAAVGIAARHRRTRRQPAA